MLRRFVDIIEFVLKLGLADVDELNLEEQEVNNVKPLINKILNIYSVTNALQDESVNLS